MTAQENLSHCIEFDFQQTSVQLAVYPGDGISGYPKHCDRSKTPTQQGMQRIVTCVYYVTPHDWNADLDGGCLRVYCPNNNMEYHDVVPYSNRMAVFRSDIVDHQVMPSLQRDRMALTIWLYGKVRDDFVVVSKRNLLLQPPAVNNNSSDTVDALTLPPPLTVSSDTSENDDKTIFVSIAAYRDSELGPTLRSLMATAQYPQRVHVGICLQVDATADACILQSLPRNETWFDTNVKMITLEARHARGPCYARDLCQRLYQQEDFVLQTDSHMRFRPRWDSYLIEQIQKCPSPQKSMLTAYPVGYQLPNEIPNETRATLLVPWKFDSDGMLRQRGRLLEPRDTSAPCHLYAAGFNFAFASVIAKVPYDGGLQYLFFGEELSMAVRLYTHGFNLYAPPEQVCYHLWSRSHRPTPLQETISPKVKQQQEVQRKAARQVVLAQLQGEQGRGLGTERTVVDFAEALGVDFAAQTINPEAPLGGLQGDEFAMDATTLAPDSLEGQVASLDVKTQARIMSFLSAMNA
jgi:[Skp1-protein]-hydroxyproline N-acetylglucosaminyltransferase